MPEFATFPLSPYNADHARYRWHITGESPRTYDLIVDNDTARMEPAEHDAAVDVTLHCDGTTFALLMYKRLSLEPVRAQGRVVVEGDQELTMVLDAWLKQA
jgi:hypothetical protein